MQSTYDRNELNQYTRVFRAGDPNAAVLPTYDADGNLTELGVAVT